MLKSMTGYGEATFEDDRRRVSVEVKSINAKYADISLRLPRAFSAQEIAWKNLVITQLGRGKITLSLRYEQKGMALPAMQINQELFKAYYATLQSLAEAVNASSTALFQLALQAPEVITPTDHDAVHTEANQVIEAIIQGALRQCDQSRKLEGAVLAASLTTYLKAIRKGLAAIEKLAPSRVKTIREKLCAGITALKFSYAIDENRLEQELIYHIERLDITEETVRLAKHLAYFEEVMESNQAEGKKLGFIAQEIGREVNTIGAKANDAAMQKEVILMKDELEKIKEQLQNIL